MRPARRAKSNTLKKSPEEVIMKQPPILIMDILRSIIYNEQYVKWFGYEVFNQVLSKGGKFKICQPTKIKILEIDCVDDLKLIKERFA